MRIWSTVSARLRRKLPSSAFCSASRSAILSSVIGFLVAHGEVGQLHLSRTSRWPPRLHRKVHHLRGRYLPAAERPEPSPILTLKIFRRQQIEVDHAVGGAPRRILRALREDAQAFGREAL